MNIRNCRIKNPYNLISETKLLEFEEKISGAMRRLAQNPNNGGNPFLFVSSVGKYHIISDKLQFPTAATDGVYFYWHPDYLDKLSERQITVVLEHEIFHIVSDHCRPSRINGRNTYIWNIAVDYVVNTNIEFAWRKRKNCENIEYSPFNHPLWTDNLNLPLSLENFKGLIDGSCDIFEKGTCLRYVDISLYGKPAELIYYEIMEHIKKSNKTLHDLLTMPWTFDCDDHMEPALTPTELIDYILRAIITTRQLHGTVPDFITEALGNLVDPQTSLQDYIMQILQHTNSNLNKIKDFSKFRKRFISNKYYFPKTKGKKAKFIALLDTSGSMSESDIAFGASELQVFDSKADGVVVPVDAAVHWEAITKVKHASDVAKIKVVGRGGTVFDDFFTQFKSKLKSHGPFSLVIIITDGGFGTISPNLDPKIPVVWVLTEEYENFQVPFGRAIQLRNPNRKSKYISVNPNINISSEKNENDDVNVDGIEEDIELKTGT